MFPFLALLVELLLLIGSEDRPDLRPDRIARRSPRLLLVFHVLLRVGRRLHQDRTDLVLLRVSEGILLAQPVEMMVGHLLRIDRSAFVAGTAIVTEPTLMTFELAITAPLVTASPEAAMLLATPEASGTAEVIPKALGPGTGSGMLESLVPLALKAAMMTAHEGDDQDRHHHHIQHQTGNRYGLGPNQSGIRSLGNGLAHRILNKLRFFGGRAPSFPWEHRSSNSKTRPTRHSCNFFTYPGKTPGRASPLRIGLETMGRL